MTRILFLIVMMFGARRAVTHEDWSNVNVRSAFFRGHTEQLLLAADIQTVGEMLQASEYELATELAIPFRSMNEIRNFLHRHGIPWPDSPFTSISYARRKALWRGGVRTLPDYFRREKDLEAVGLRIPKGTVDLWRTRMAQEAEGPCPAQLGDRKKL